MCVAIEGKSEPSITIDEGTKYGCLKLIQIKSKGSLTTWSEIWEEKEGQLKRGYTYDFEKYYLDGNVDIYISVK